MDGCLDSAGDLLWYRGTDGELVFVSLAQPAAALVASVPLNAGSTGRSCPVKHPTKPQFVYVEYTDTKSEIWGVEASSGGVGTPTKHAEMDLDPYHPQILLTPQLFGG